MVEAVFAWVCIIAAGYTKDPMWAAASAIFALAAHVCDLKKVLAKGDLRCRD